MRHLLIVCLLAACLLMNHSPTPTHAAEPGAKLRAAKELGKVHWWRDYAAAKAEAKKKKKPLLVLFDEVPG